MAGWKVLSSAENIATHRSKTIIHFELDYTAATGTYTIPVKSGCFVHNMGIRFLTNFDGTGTDLSVGDGDDTVGYFAVADLATNLATAPAVGAAQINLMSGAAQDYANGKYYTADDTIDFVFTSSTSGTPTTGLLKGWVEISYVANDGLATGTSTTA